MEVHFKYIKYLNNIVEQDHLFIKRKVKAMLGFNSFENAEQEFAVLNLCI